MIIESLLYSAPWNLQRELQILWSDTEYQKESHKRKLFASKTHTRCKECLKGTEWRNMNERVHEAKDLDTTK